MTKPRYLPQSTIDVKLPPVSIELLNLIKINRDQGKSTYFKDIIDHFHYKNHQPVSNKLKYLKRSQLVQCHWEGGKRVIDITSKGVDYLYDLGCSYLTKLEQVWMRKLRTEGKVKAPYGTISQIVFDFTRNLVPDQINVIKEVISQEFGGDQVPEAVLLSIEKIFRQVSFDLTKDFIENYSEDIVLQKKSVTLRSY